MECWFGAVAAYVDAAIRQAGAINTNSIIFNLRGVVTLAGNRRITFALIKFAHFKDPGSLLSCARTHSQFKLFVLLYFPLVITFIDCFAGASVDVAQAYWL
jgi:hypothetical protein